MTIVVALEDKRKEKEQSKRKASIKRLIKQAEKHNW